MSGIASSTLVEALGLHVQFGGRHSLFKPPTPVVRAVDGVDLIIPRGHICGLVGESGSGKSTLGRAILGLEKLTKGTIRFDGAPVDSSRPAQLGTLRQRMQLIPQDAAASLSPRFTVRQLLDEVSDIRGIPSRMRIAAEDLLAQVELNREHAHKYPHQLSGGQAKRVSIARALAMGPAFLVADEPTAGLDASALGGIINLLMRLRSDRSMTYLVITHDLDAVAYMADTVAVMYLGRIVELGPTLAVVDSPRHPYTKALLKAVRRTGQSHQPLALNGDIPSPRSLPIGCRFNTRCPYARPLCKAEDPALEQTNGHGVACHFWRDLDDRPPSRTTLARSNP